MPMENSEIVVIGVSTIIITQEVSGADLHPNNTISKPMSKCVKI